MTGVEIAAVVSIGVNLIQGWITRRHRKKAKALPAIIRGVEAATNNKDVKVSIRAAATAAGVQDTLHTEVKRLGLARGRAPHSE